MTATGCPLPGRTSTSWPPGRGAGQGTGTLLQVCAQPLGWLASGAAHHDLRGLQPHWHAQLGKPSPPSRLPWTAALACALNQPLCLQPGQVVGVDLEWGRLSAAGGRPRVSLMQVAVEGRVFLLDLPQLSNPAGGQAPRAFSAGVSAALRSSITKLGE